MTREEVLALLRQRIPETEVVDLIGRRHPDTEPALELVPLTLGLLAERGNAAARVSAAIPELTEQCRTLLRLRLHGRSFDEIREEMDTDALAVWVRCRRRLFGASTPLPEYAAGLLSANQRLGLFAEALRDHALFQSLRDEHTLLALLEDPAARAQLLAATEEVRFTIRGGLREWFERPRSKVMVLLGLAAGIAILVQQCGSRGAGLGRTAGPAARFSAVLPVTEDLAQVSNLTHGAGRLCGPPFCPVRPQATYSLHP